MKKNSVFKRVLSLMLVLSLLLSVLPTSILAADAETAETGTFTDVTTDHWAYEYVEKAYSLGLMNGMTTTTFSPDTTMTRGMFVTVLSRLAGVEVDDDTETCFTDVPGGEYYTGAVAWAYEKGIVNGLTATTFGPEEEITRQDAVTLLYRYANIYGIELPEGDIIAFTDADEIDDYARDAVETLTAAGILTGHGDGSFAPKDSLTRAEGATIFVRLAELIADQVYFSVSFATVHATVTVDGNATTFCSVLSGEDLTFTVTADEGYHLNGISTSSANLTENEDGSYTLTAVSEDIDITVIAEADPTYVVSFETVNATAYVEGEAVEFVTVDQGADLTFTVEADENCTISAVIADAGTLTENEDGSYTLADITENITVAISADEQEPTPVEPALYTITFVTDDGVKVYVNGVETDTATVSSEDAYFTFACVLTQEHIQVNSIVASPAGNINAAGNLYMLTGITGDTTITVSTGMETFRVRFSTGGDATTVDAQEVEYLGTATQPEDPSRDGYYFGGWYADATLLEEFDFSTPITEDTVLYACWLKPVDTVYLNGVSGSNNNDGSSEDTAVLTFQMAAKLVKYSTTKTIVLDGMITVEDTQVWDLSDVPDAVVVAGSSMSGYSAFMISVSGYGDLTINNVHFDGNADRDANVACTFAKVIYSLGYNSDQSATVLYGTGTLTLNNCELENFGSLPNGTSGYDVYYSYTIFTYGTLIINGGSFHDNLTPNGSVIYQSTYSAVYINGGEFYNNEAREHDYNYANGYGGAIYVGNHVLSITGAVFHDNTAVCGGAIYCSTATGSTNPNLTNDVTIADCTFYNNTATNGGAIFIATYATEGVDLEGSNCFYSNTATEYGGAIYAGRVLNIAGGTFYGNKASSGAGLYLYSNAVVTITPDENAELAFNDSYYIGNSTGLLIAGSVAGNKGSFAAEFALATSGRTLATGSDYTVTDEDAAVFTVAGDSESTIIVNEDKNTIVIGTVSDTGSGDSDSEEEEDENAAHNLSEVYLNGSTGSDSNDGTTSSTAVKTFAVAKSLLAKDGTIYITGVVTVSGSESWSLDEATYGDAKVVRASGYTTGKLVTVTGALTLSNITIDGNGVTATSSGASAIYVSGGMLTVNEGTILSNHKISSTYSPCIYAVNGATVVMNGGLITGCTSSSSYGAIIYMGTSCYFKMTGGTISGNSTTNSYSPVIYVGSSSAATGTAEISGGTISGNTTGGSYSGGVYVGNYGTLNYSGGTITGNTFSGTSSGAITGTTYVDITISGGEITNNTVKQSAVTSSSYSTVNMTGGLISGNTSASSYGGGMNIGAYGTLTMTGGEISDNTATMYGGGIAASSGTVNLLGGTISGNTATTYGGGVAISGSATVTIGAITITGNTATTYGGGIAFNSGAYVTIDGATITNNTATTYGGGIFTSTGLGSLELISGTISGNVANEARGAGIYIQKTKVVTIAPGESGLEIADQIYVTNTSVASGGKIVLINDLTSLTGTLNFNFLYLVSGTVVAEAVDDYTITESDLAKFGCDGCKVIYSQNDSGQIIMSTNAVEGISLNVSELEIMATYTGTITATLTPEDASNQNITWTSSDTSVAKVSGSSLEAVVTGVSAGTATITATTSDGGYTATCTVTVTENTTPIVSITLDQSEAIMVIGDTTALTATITPDNAYSTEITWSTSDDSVVSISGSGSTVTLTAVDNGTATVTATAADGKSASCVITVANVAVTGITLSKSSVTVPEGDIATLGSYTITPGNANNQTVTWTVGDESIAQITVDGTSATVKGISAGTTTVTVTTEDGGYSASCEVTVTEVSNAMTLDITSMDMIIYQSFNLTALFESHVEDVTWSTSDSTVVSILSTEGNQVTVKAGGSEGSVTITATSESGQSATCAITVTGVAAGTATDVYVDGYYGSDSNSGTSPSSPVASWKKAISLLGVDGTIHIGVRCSITANAVISLPEEIYGNAKIDFYTDLSTSTSGFTLSGNYNIYISDVTIDATNLSGQLVYLPTTYSGSTIALSNNVTVTGGSGRIAYIAAGTMIINGGTYSDITRTGSYGVIYATGGTVSINGGTFSNISGGTYGGLIGLFSTAYINGGTFTGISGTGYGGCIAVMSSGALYLRGGTFSDLSAGYANSDLCYVTSDGLTIDPIYGVIMEAKIYLNSGYTFTIASSLETLNGSICVRLGSASSGTTVATGTSHELNSEDLAKISIYNSGYTAVLNSTKNTIVLA